MTNPCEIRLVYAPKSYRDRSRGCRGVAAFCLVNLDGLVLQSEEQMPQGTEQDAGDRDIIEYSYYLYLRLGIGLSKPLLDVTGNGEKNLLHVEVCLGTLKDSTQ